VDYTLTSEQQRIIEHPLHKHARVLAVAGSGKTTTMVHRVRHLVMDLNQDPRRIRVVMFNRLAREDFEKQLEEAIFEVGKRPKVLTFHALAYALRTEAEKKGLLARYTQLWTGEREELALICMHRAIDSLMREGLIEDDVDAKDALDAVGLWKASLIPPERAGHRTNPDLPDVYRRFEEFRLEARALTFDDFVPVALDLMKENPTFRQRFAGHLDHLIVDEYQDVNYGQQQLLTLLAGRRADVMVVGDDDQTIYEWRAARPHYILQGFKEDFGNKPVVDYTLSRSFRFGPLVAQAAHNVILLNQHREPKPLVAHDVAQDTGITVFRDESEQPTQVEIEMAEEIETLVRKEYVPPKRIGVLGRTFVQLEGLQAVCIRRRIPFRVVGMAPFFERDENRTLIDYVRLALNWDRPATAMKPLRTVRATKDEEESAQSRASSHYRLRYSHGPFGEAIRTVLAVANTPSRKLARVSLRKAVERGGRRGLALGASLELLVDDQESPLSVESRDNLHELVDFLRRIRERVEGEPNLKAGDLLEWIVEHTDYYEHYSRYYGEGFASLQRIASIGNFIGFASGTNKSILDFIDYLRKLDPTLGLDLDKVITMTTVHRTKGLEYDYVFIPHCVEGHMPVHIADEVPVYDTEGIVPDHPASPALESERRLFYVALTRTIKHAYIGTITAPPAGQQAQSATPLPSRFLEEIQLGATSALISAFQATLASHSSELERTLVDLASYRSLILSVADHYLPHLGDRTLQARARQLAEQTPELPFQYQHAYPALDQPVRHKDEEPVPPPWPRDPWEHIGDTSQ
jgi:DNA helicase-2/ATP-dependent DNA helicase PcrA